MTENNGNGRSDLAGFPYHELLNVARSAGLDFDGQPKKDELTDRMVEANIAYEDGRWRRDGEGIQRQPVQSGSGSTEPRDKTVLYCLTREETTEERVEAISEALAGIGYDLREAGTDGDKFKIVIPAEVEGESDEDLEEMTKEELYEMASEKEIDGRSEMTKAELVEALAA